DSNLRAIVYWGHAPNSQTRGLEMKRAMEKVDIMVIIDPYPSAAAAMPDRKDGVYLLPAATQMETSGSVTASNRSLQWREKVIEPLSEPKPARESGGLWCGSRSASRSPTTRSCWRSRASSASARSS